MNVAANLDEPDSVEMNGLLKRVMQGVNGQAFRLFGPRVIFGLFAGMQIPQRVPWDDDNQSCKLLGTYEWELAPSFEYALWRQPQIMVNVGCAEGYYAIGLARLMADVKVYALDISRESRNLCAEYAQKNGVYDRVDLIDGAKTPEELNVAQPGHKLFVVDCEGDELDLIDLGRCPALREADVIVECHDFLKSGTSRILADRLAETHRVELIEPKLPKLEGFTFLKRCPSVLAALMVVEKRPMPCCWLACWSNRRG